MSDEVEITENIKGDYEITPVAPMNRLERRVDQLEKSGTLPQLQSLVTQIIELIRTNQRLIDSIIRADSDLRTELSKIPPKIDELTTEMKKILGMIEYAGKEEVAGVGTESMKPVVENLEKLIESNQMVLESLESMNKKIKSGTPVSQLLSAYPRLRTRGEGMSNEV